MISNAFILKVAPQALTIPALVLFPPAVITLMCCTCLSFT